MFFCAACEIKVIRRARMSRPRNVACKSHSFLDYSWASVVMTPSEYRITPLKNWRPADRARLSPITPAILPELFSRLSRTLNNNQPEGPAAIQASPTQSQHPTNSLEPTQQEIPKETCSACCCVCPFGGLVGLSHAFSPSLQRHFQTTASTGPGPEYPVERRWHPSTNLGGDRQQRG